MVQLISDVNWWSNRCHATRIQPQFARTHDVSRRRLTPWNSCRLYKNNVRSKIGPVGRRNHGHNLRVAL